MQVSRTKPTTLSIPELRSEIAGRVIAPDDDDYDAARTVQLGDMEARPAVIVQVANDADVARVIGLARETGLELAVRSGGHSGAGHGTTEGGIVLDCATHEGARDRRRGANGLGRERADRGRIHDGCTRARSCDRLRRHRLRRARRAHPRRRRRLPGPQARPDDRQPARRRRRHCRWREAARGRGLAPRPLLGDPGRRRQLRCRHPLQVPAPPPSVRS